MWLGGLAQECDRDDELAILALHGKMCCRVCGAVQHCRRHGKVSVPRPARLRSVAAFHQGPPNAYWSASVGTRRPQSGSRRAVANVRTGTETALHGDRSVEGRSSALDSRGMDQRAVGIGSTLSGFCPAADAPPWSRRKIESA